MHHQLVWLLIFHFSGMYVCSYCYCVCMCVAGSLSVGMIIAVVIGILLFLSFVFWVFVKFRHHCQSRAKETISNPHPEQEAVLMTDPRARHSSEIPPISPTPAPLTLTLTLAPAPAPALAYSLNTNPPSSAAVIVMSERARDIEVSRATAAVSALFNIPPPTYSEAVRAPQYQPGIHLPIVDHPGVRYQIARESGTTNIS